MKRPTSGRPAQAQRSFMRWGSDLFEPYTKIQGHLLIKEVRYEYRNDY